jgi:GT2 family glycosyltransferase
MFIVITDFNGFSQTRRCLAALRASRFQNFTTVVVDHGTSNETRNNLAEEFPEVIRLSGAPHLWWAGATNTGIRYSLDKCAKAVMLLNNDCYVTPDTIGELFALWTEHQGAIIAPIQRDCQSGAITTITPSSSFLLGFPSLSGPRQLTSAMQAKRLLPTKIIAGGRGALINAELFKTFGFFDEKQLPHYWADHDFYLRVYKQGGVPLFIATRSFVDLDSARTTMADNPGRLTFQQWIYSLHSIRSHHNLAHVTELFKRHYPFRRLYMFGVMLYTGRYFIVYLFRRMVFLLNKLKIS